MDESTGLPADHPSHIQFTMLALDNSHATHQLQVLTAGYHAERRRYVGALTAIDDLRHELATEESRVTGTDYDEGERRQRVQVLTNQLAGVITPEPPGEDQYRVMRSILEMKLRESAHLNTSLLVWQAQSTPN